MRPIDADAMLAELKPIDYEMEHSSVLISDVSNIMRNWVNRQPTLTPPNEPLTWEELTEETKINPVYSMKYGWIFPDTVKDEPYKQIWFVTSKGFVNTELFYQDTFYRHPPERQEANNNGD